MEKARIDLHQSITRGRHPFPTLTPMKLFQKGSVVLLTLGLLFPVSTEAVTDVRQFGAVGDGMHDDTTAFEKLIQSPDFNGELVISPGTYRLTRTLEFPLTETGWISVRGTSGSVLLMDGPGPAIRFVGSHQGTADPGSVKPPVWEKERMPSVTDLTFTGGHPEADAIEARRTMQLTLRGLHVRGMRHGVHLVERNRNVILSDCHFYENSGIGLFLDHVNLHQINVSNCHISYNRGGGVVVLGGDVRNLHIGTSDLEGNQDPMGAPTSNVLIDTDAPGGSIGEVAITGCTIQHSHTAPGSANIRILGPGAVRNFTEETRDGNITITGNVLSDVGVNIHLRQFRGVAITGNTLWKGYERNLLVEDCIQVTVSGNVMDRNPRYGYGDGNDALLGVRFQSCRDVLFASNSLRGSSHPEGALVFQDCSWVQVQGCQILDGAGRGLGVSGCHQVRVTDCTLGHRENPGLPPLEVTRSTGIWILNNLLLSRSNPVPPGDATWQGNRVTQP